jgi:hypothetical protein
VCRVDADTTADRPTQKSAPIASGRSHCRGCSTVASLRAEGLVEQKYLGLYGERSREGHALQLSAGEWDGQEVRAQVTREEAQQLELAEGQILPVRLPEPRVFAS